MNNIVPFFFLLFSVGTIESLWACRLVCSSPEHLYHLYAPDDTQEVFEIAQDARVIAQDLRCVLLEKNHPSSEEMRMINSCVGITPQGEPVRFETTLRTVQSIENDKLSTKTTLAWSLTPVNASPEKEKHVQRILHLEFDRSDCGSASDR